jgi:hypothetical protein
MRAVLLDWDLGFTIRIPSVPHVPDAAIEGLQDSLNVDQSVAKAGEGGYVSDQHCDGTTGESSIQIPSYHLPNVRQRPSPFLSCHWR